MRRQVKRLRAAETAAAEARAERDALWLEARRGGVTSTTIANIYDVNPSRVAQVTGPNGRGKR